MLRTRQLSADGNASLDLGLQAGGGLWYSSFLLKTAHCSNRAAWVGILVCAVVLQFAQTAQAQNPAWDPGLPKEVFKNGNPPERLRAAKCKECDDKMAALQAALDDWYAMQLAEAEKALNDEIKPPPKTQERLEKQKADALKGLGDPKDGGKSAKDKQKENTAKDLKDKQNKGKKPKDILKDKIAKALKDLQDCEANCPQPGAGQPEQPQTPGEQPVQPGGGGGQVQPPPVFDLQIPPLPPCFDSEKDRQAHRDKLDDLQKKLTTVKKKYGMEFAEPPDNAWKEFKEKWENAIKEINDQAFPGDDGKSKIDKAPICTPKGGGGKATGPGKGKPKAPPKVRTGGNVSLPEDNFCALISENKIKIDTAGTGETIGHVADVTIENLTDQPLTVAIPPVVLESKSGKNQDYAIPKGETVEVPPHEKKTVPLDGICLVRNKPPVGKGQTGDLLINDCDGGVHIPKDKANDLLRIAESKYDAADKLEEDGKLKEMPYRDKKKRKEIVEQWSTWMDPRISEITGAPPATKDDLKKVVEKQVGKVPPDKQKKIDEGMDTIFAKIELTNEKAKDLEKPGGETVEETPPVGEPEYVGQTGFGHTQAKQPTPTATPKPKGGGKTKSKPTPTPTPTPKSGGGPKTEEKPKDTYKNPPDKVKPPKAKYPQKKEIDCGTISIDMGTKGDLIFDFTPNGKCPCKKFGWIQHFRTGDDDENPVWHYDNETQPSVAHAGSGQGAISHPDKPRQPTQPPAGTKEDEWDENPWYGGTTDEEKAKNGFAKHPTSQQKVSDKPNHPNTTYRMQLVCVDTGEVLFTWAWGPFPEGNESPDSVGGGQIEPPPLKK